MMREYAVYRGDEFLAVGTAKECAKTLGVKPDTIYFMASRAYRKIAADSPNRTIAIRLEDDDQNAVRGEESEA